jgi:hypothetical protein
MLEGLERIKTQIAERNNEFRGRFLAEIKSILPGREVALLFWIERKDSLLGKN